MRLTVLGKKDKGMQKHRRRKDKGRGQRSKAEVWRGGLVWAAIRTGNGMGPFSGVKGV